MLLKEFVTTSRSRLSGLYPDREAASITGILCREFFSLEGYTFLVEPSRHLDDRDVQKALAAQDRLASGEPLQYVLGYTEFYGRRFNVSPAVLIPRPETEELCRIATDAAVMLQRGRDAYGSNAAPVRILDLCTGSGCIAWTLAANVPGARVVGLDISQEALEVARRQHIDSEGMVAPRFVQADIFDERAVLSALEGEAPFDMILSNPPYVLEKERAAMRRNVLDFEPSIALFVPDDDFGLFYRKISFWAGKLLKTDSMGLVEINEAFGDGVSRIFEADGFREIKVFRDISGRERIVRFKK